MCYRGCTTRRCVAPRAPFHKKLLMLVVMGLSLVSRASPVPRRHADIHIRARMMLLPGYTPRQTPGGLTTIRRAYDVSCQYLGGCGRGSSQPVLLTTPPRVVPSPWQPEDGYWQAPPQPWGMSGTEHTPQPLQRPLTSAKTLWEVNKAYLSCTTAGTTALSTMYVYEIYTQSRTSRPSFARDFVPASSRCAGRLGIWAFFVYVVVPLVNIACGNFSHLARRYHGSRLSTTQGAPNPAAR